MKHPASSLLSKLILNRSGQSRLWVAWATLTVGLAMLLLAVMVWWNFRQLLNGNQENDSLGSTFLTLSKTVTDATMGQDKATQFTTSEIQDLRSAPQVQDVGVLTPAAFPVQARMGGRLNFYTLLFLESAPDKFMDKMPEDWHWQPGEQSLPIILSRDFLNMYNYVFAPSQGLPQLSENAIKALGFTITIGQGGGQEAYHARITGFSDRISSVLVPEAFMQYANHKFASGVAVVPSRVLVRTADPSNEQFNSFLEQHGYATNAEQLRWNKVRSIVQGVSFGTGVLAALLIGIGALVFVLFIELTMAKAQESVRLLLQLGYSPKQLKNFLGSKFLPLLLGSIVAALVIAVVAQFVASVQLEALQLKVSSIPGPPVWMVAGISALLLYWQMRNAIAKALKST